MRPLILAIALSACDRTKPDTDPDTDLDTSADTDADTLEDPLPDDVVTPEVLRGWHLLDVNTASAAFAIAPDGRGSVQLATGDGTAAAGGDWPAWEGAGGKAYVGFDGWNGTRIDAIDTLAYGALVTANHAQTLVLVPYVNLFVDLDGNGVFDAAVDDLWVYDPVQFGGESQVSVTGTWQRWDALGAEAEWRCVHGNTALGDGVCDGSTRASWDELVAAQPSAEVVAAACGEAPWPDPDADCATPDPDAPGLLFLAGQKSGGGWADWVGYLDAIEVGPGGPDGGFDFEP